MNIVFWILVFFALFSIWLLLFPIVSIGMKMIFHLEKLWEKDNQIEDKEEGYIEIGQKDEEGEEKWIMIRK